MDNATLRRLIVSHPTTKAWDDIAQAIVAASDNATAYDARAKKVLQELLRLTINERARIAGELYPGIQWLACTWKPLARL